MKLTQWCALLLPLALGGGQQKTYKWIPGDDETVRLDPGNYHGGRAFLSTAHIGDVHVDVDAQQPVTISMISAQGAMQLSIPKPLGACLGEHLS